MFRPSFWLAAFVGMVAASSGASANLIVNPDFAPAGPNPSPGYGDITGWTRTAFDSGVPNYPVMTGSNTSAGPFFDNGVLPDGVTTAGFIQVFQPVGTDYLSQMLNLVVGQTYVFSYLESARNGIAISTPILEVLLGGDVLVAAHSDPAVGGTNPFRSVSATFTATAPTEDLVFLASQTRMAGPGFPGDDAAPVVTEVTVDIPEPAPFAVLVMGVAGLWTLRRTRRT